MIVIVAGPRAKICQKYGITFQTVCEGIEASGLEITYLVSGCADGVDSFGERWAMKKGVKIKRMPADWHTYGKAAGGIRNQGMLDFIAAHAEEWGGCALVALWCDAAVEAGESRGTPDMVERTLLASVLSYVHHI